MPVCGAISPGLTHCVADRFMPFGAGAACSWTRFHRRSRISRFKVMKAEPYLRVPLNKLQPANAGASPPTHGTESRSASYIS